MHQLMLKIMRLGDAVQRQAKWFRLALVCRLHGNNAYATWNAKIASFHFEYGDLATAARSRTYRSLGPRRQSASEL